MSRRPILAALTGSMLLFQANVGKGADKESSMNSSRMPMLGAVMYSETDEVRRLAEKKQGLNERNPDDQATPLIYAAATDQWLSVEILIDNGADIWAHDEFGKTAGSFVLDSRIGPGSKEDQARHRVIEKLKARGFPLPAPSWAQVLELDKEGKWPPAGAVH